MRRSELEHVIRASGDIAKDDEIIIIGSQSILGQFPDAPARLLASMDVDLYPRNKPELVDKIDAAIGEGSLFHEQNGYYAQGVGPESAVLPDRWEDRLIEVNNENTNGVSGLCLEVHDLSIAKLVAARCRDIEFLQELVRRQMVDQLTLTGRLAQTRPGKATSRRIELRIAALYSK